MLETNQNIERARRENYPPSIVYSRSLKQVIEKYNDVCEALNKIADEVPNGTENIEELIAREQALFDEHATLLNDAMSMEVRSMDDVQAIMTLWKNEVVGDSQPCDLNVSDQIVLSVCNFLEAK